ncbi:MAG: hypothetical protein EBW87_03740 [Burkholderiaceae bacterium]|nr:hypothetical protein [Burkholderiaceae bacterium]
MSEELKLVWAWEPKFASPPFEISILHGRHVRIQGVRGFNLLYTASELKGIDVDELANTMLNLVELRYAQEQTENL